MLKSQTAAFFQLAQYEITCHNWFIAKQITTAITKQNLTSIPQSHIYSAFQTALSGRTIERQL